MSESKVSGKTLGQALCNALGIDTKMVRSISVKADASEAAIVTTEHLVSGAQCDELARVLKSYLLVENRAEREMRRRGDDIHVPLEGGYTAIIPMLIPEEGNVADGIKIVTPEPPQPINFREFL